MYPYCIPYNDETKHLVGTAEEEPEYYKPIKEKYETNTFN